MCGIHGFLWSDPEAMTTMIKIAHHRGPDGNGQWHNDNITLGHNLLSITDDASDSIQPWQHNNLVITYNGEIYNYRQLRKTLNYNFKTDTDTEVLAVGLEQRGLKFLEEIDGMFAFACYNKQDKTLLLLFCVKNLAQAFLLQNLMRKIKNILPKLVIVQK